MSQATCKFIFLLFLFLNATTFAGEKKHPEMRSQIQELFSHKFHDPLFQKAKISCTDCHSFAVKSQAFDPLAKNVDAGFMKANRQVCHECHMGKVELPRVNQCSLCHLNPEKLAPSNHNLAWKKRHGHYAQIDPESCNTCHKENQNSCQNCHTQKNTLKPMVHRPNFRLTHSIEARTNPAKCTTCHTNTNSCTQCHKGGFP